MPFGTTSMRATGMPARCAAAMAPARAFAMTAAERDRMKRLMRQKRSDSSRYRPRIDATMGGRGRASQPDTIVHSSAVSENACTRS